VGRTLNQVTVQVEKLIGHPVQRSASVWAAVEVRQDPAVFMYQENILASIPDLYAEPAATAFRQVSQTANCLYGCTQ